MFMMNAKGLIIILVTYFEEIETVYLGAGTGFLALITDGVSRAIQGQKDFWNLRMALTRCRQPKTTGQPPR